jgi:hypothetical protein
MAAYMLYKERKEGILSTFPFGAMAFARLDERLKDDPLWREAKREAGRDPMRLTPKQPNVEFFTTEVGRRMPSNAVVPRQSVLLTLTSCMVGRSNTTNIPSVSVAQ